jgi:hypothetical protein
MYLKASDVVKRLVTLISTYGDCEVNIGHSGAPILTILENHKAEIVGPGTEGESRCFTLFPTSDIFTVSGYWPDTGQRFTDYVAAANANEAEVIIGCRHPNLVIVSTFVGKIHPAESETKVKVG